MEYKMKAVSNIIRIIILIVCVSLVIIGQKNIGYSGLIMMMAGLAGILLLLYFYNRKYK